jgi:hypothetical protein
MIKRILKDYKSVIHVFFARKIGVRFAGVTSKLRPDGVMKAARKNIGDRCIIY